VSNLETSEKSHWLLDGVTPLKQQGERCCACVSTGASGGSFGRHDLDVDATVAASMQRGALLWVLPWISSFLLFGSPTVANLLSPTTLRQLSALRCALDGPLSKHMFTKNMLESRIESALPRFQKQQVLFAVQVPHFAGQLQEWGDWCVAGRAADELRPSHKDFSPAALCLRCLLDDLLDRLPPAAPQQGNAKALQPLPQVPLTFHGPMCHVSRVSCMEAVLLGSLVCDD
jgi:hypothetical protein